MLGPETFIIRDARLDDLPGLGALELRAASRFADSAHRYACDLPPFDAAELGALQRAGTVWVAASSDDRPIGFAIGGWLGADPYLHELDVEPTFARRGIGRALLGRVAEWARSTGCASLLLSTFDDVPWNAPYYARLGFEVIPLEVYSPEMRAQLAREADAGMRMANRVMMRADLARLLPQA